MLLIATTTTPGGGEIAPRRLKSQSSPNVRSSSVPSGVKASATPHRAVARPMSRLRASRPRRNSRQEGGFHRIPNPWTAALISLPGRRQPGRMLASYPSAREGVLFYIPLRCVHSLATGRAWSQSKRAIASPIGRAAAMAMRSAGAICAAAMLSAIARWQGVDSPQRLNRSRERGPAHRWHGSHRADDRSGCLAAGLTRTFHLQDQSHATHTGKGRRPEAAAIRAGLPQASQRKVTGRSNRSVWCRRLPRQFLILNEAGRSNRSGWWWRLLPRCTWS